MTVRSIVDPSSLISSMTMGTRCQFNLATKMGTVWKVKILAKKTNMQAQNTTNTQGTKEPCPDSGTLVISVALSTSSENTRI